MAYLFNNLNITKISVIGAGQIGPDIALHFTKSLYLHDVQIINLDISPLALETAKNKAWKKIQKDVEKGAITSDESEKIKSALIYSSDYENVRGSQIVVEAATENENIKDSIFLQVEKLTDDSCIYLSNSSHMQPEVIFRNIKNKTRCLVAHYFFPADRNPVVEIVPSEKTDTDITLQVLEFYKSIGKHPIQVKSSYGYAIDPIFEGLCETAILCLEKGWGNEKQIDKIACETLGLGVGPFTALNFTGGNPITAHGLDEMGKQLMPWFKTPEILHEAVKNKTQWVIAGRDEIIEVPDELKEKLRLEFLGAYFSLCAYIMDRNIITLNDLDQACKLSLVVKPPFTIMNELGTNKSLELVEGFCARHQNFAVPKSLIEASKMGQWNLNHEV
ncbi:MAG: 3-hydroxyacyl-CoA dehydrogenase family protein [Bacteroidota bacterium]|nr:3-hydroxyacyl-CoA dehydrogenase family protein [Bacteroidota bacterium]